MVQERKRKPSVMVDSVGPPSQAIGRRYSDKHQSSRCWEGFAFF